MEETIHFNERKYNNMTYRFELVAKNGSLIYEIYEDKRVFLEVLDYTKAKLITDALNDYEVKGKLQE